MRARRLPQLVLPAPGIPMSTTFLVSERSSSSIFSRSSSSMACPWKSSLEKRAWPTSMARPLSLGMPSSSAMRQSSVRSGL